jgi:hypothetical protein
MDLSKVVAGLVFVIGAGGGYVGGLSVNRKIAHAASAPVRKVSGDPISKRFIADSADWSQIDSSDPVQLTANDDLNTHDGWLASDVEEKLKEALGSQRYAEYRDTFLPENRLLSMFARAYHLTDDQIDQIRALRANAPNEQATQAFGTIGMPFRVFWIIPLRYSTSFPVIYIINPRGARNELEHKNLPRLPSNGLWDRGFDLLFVESESGSPIAGAGAECVATRRWKRYGPKQARSTFGLVRTGVHEFRAVRFQSARNKVS